MKTRQSASLASAALLAALALAACQNPESTAPDALESVPGLEALETRMVPEGRPATAEERAAFLAGQGTLPDFDPSENGAPVAKTAALATCIADFNQQTALDRLPFDAFDGLARAPHYMHGCPGNYLVKFTPVFGNEYRLTPEAANWCKGTPYNIGTKSGAACVNQSPAMNWPRRAGTFGGQSGIQMLTTTSSNVLKTYNLQAVTVTSGTAKVVGYFANGTIQVWPNLTAGRRWTWPAGTVLRNMQIFHQDGNNIVHFDNVEIAINP